MVNIFNKFYIRRITNFRKCIRCGAEMEENYKITSGYGIVLRPEKGRNAVKLKAAVCPQCGEASIYVDDPDKLIGRKKA